MPSVYIALGANLPSPAGLPPVTLAVATERLAGFGRIAARSSLYSTTPVGLVDQPRFTNAVLALETQLSPRNLLAALLDIEREFARNRAPVAANGPRTLDLDLLLYGDLVAGMAGLELPHPRLTVRAFVLVPLHEIAPHLHDPRSGKTVAQLLATLPSSADLEAVAPIACQGWTAKIDP